jgi:hypothetical protein
MQYNTIETANRPPIILDPQTEEEPTEPLTGNKQFQVLVDELGLQNALTVMSLTESTDSELPEDL